jgi:Mg/Co/Ni transporter MgtE
MIASTLAEVRKSLPWALVVGFPMALVAASTSVWFADTAGWFGFLLCAPMLAAIALAQHGAALAGAPEPVVIKSMRNER